MILNAERLVVVNAASQSSRISGSFLVRTGLGSLAHNRAPRMAAYRRSLSVVECLKMANWDFERLLANEKNRRKLTRR